MSIRITPKDSNLPIEAGGVKDAAIIVNNLNGHEERISDLLKKYPQIEAAQTPFKKKMEVRKVISHLRNQISDEERKKIIAEGKIAFCESILKASESYPDWQKLEPKLEKNDCSRLHNLVTFLFRQSEFVDEIRRGDHPKDVPWNEVIPFVVQHDWASAFSGAGDYIDGGFKLPYDMCAFEFRITGRSVTILAFQGEDQDPTFTSYCQFGDYWVSHDDPDKEAPAIKFALAQVKAICVALDADVASHTVVRASDKINKKREEANKVPLYSYHIVSLAHRSRVANPLSGVGGATTKKRLHFRRGHWRHYENFKTWVRWTLVGNPDIGFIDKEYRL